MVEGLARQVVEKVAEAYKVLSEFAGPIHSEVLEEALREVEHIAIHELAHSAIRVAYPEIEVLWHRNEVLGECVDEVAARLIESYVSRRIGAYTHSFEEHIHELRHYTSLGNLGMAAEDLASLYSVLEKLLMEGRLRDAVEAVVGKCRDWVTATR